MTADSLPRFLLSLLVGLALLAVTTPDASTAQPTPPVDTFDLALYGTSLDASHELALRTNPWLSDEWMPVGQTDGAMACTDQALLRVVRDLPAARFLGQDIRENYIALKITTTNEEAEGALGAAYALPSADSLDADACQQLTSLIAEQPHLVRRHSLAAIQRPRPVSLTTDAPIIEHLEAPIRHRKPGVMEVEWLEILFRPE